MFDRIEFFRDGTGISFLGNTTVGDSITWQLIENDRLVLTAHGHAQVWDYRLSGSTVTLSNDSGIRATYAKDIPTAVVPETAQDRQRRAGERMALSINGVEYAFRWCPSGTFMMGNEPGEVSVTLSRGFWMLETQVTQEMWEKVMGENSSYFFMGAKFPIESVSWYNSQEFIQKLNGLNVAPAGFKFSLPTEAQWEYACRAGTTTAYHFGDTLSAAQANFGNNVEQTTEVGSYPANAWGLFDMHGNVSEWCQDRYGNYPSGAVTDPTGATGGSGRVIRGGSWFDGAQACRSAFRDSFVPSFQYFLIGFRLSLVRAD